MSKQAEEFYRSENGLKDMPHLTKSEIEKCEFAEAYHTEQCNLYGVMDWVAVEDRIPLDILENYLVYGDGQYQVTFYSVRRKEWHVDFKVTHYVKLPKPPCA